jgi:hypothetical protein
MPPGEEPRLDRLRASWRPVPTSRRPERRIKETVRAWQVPLEEKLVVEKPSVTEAILLFAYERCFFRHEDSTQ